ncbi:MAG: DUF3618 domain-containing protein, partial [Gemmatimonadaceae bacterium]
RGNRTMADRNDDLRTDATNDPAAIRAQIEDTRARMSDTLGELGDRLNPQVVKERVKESIREATVGRMEHMARKTKERLDDSSLTLMETIRENPVPAAIMAIGLGWLIVNGRRERSQSERQVALARFDDSRDEQDWYRGGGQRYDYGNELDDYEQGEGSASLGGRVRDRGEEIRDRASDFASNVRERAGDLAHKVQDAAGRVGEKASDVAHRATDRARETAGRVGDRARETAGRVGERARDVANRTTERARDVAHRTSERAQEVASNVADTSRRQVERVETLYNDNPLGIGLAVAAAGFAIGLGAPRTRAESRLVGDSRDHLVDKVKDIAQDKKERVQHVAERVFEEGKRTAKDALRDEGLVQGDQIVS